ncbi:MAG: hypothetical protein JW797_08395 [Bradymonadales bacterium]|nr:hypothetical protein [Bradymonadales bacterium]
MRDVERRRWRTVLTGGMALILLAAIGCERDRTEQLVEQIGPPVEVDLPVVPQLETDRIYQHPDGSLSVWGLLQRRDDYLGQPVRVTAAVTQIYLCPTRAQQGEYDRMIELGTRYLPPEGSGMPEAPMERCAFPHLFVADRLGVEQTLLVTGYEAELEPQLEVGQQYLFEGRYMDQARGFIRAGEGLLWVEQIVGGTLGQPTAEPLEESIQIQ